MEGRRLMPTLALTLTLALTTRQIFVEFKDLGGSARAKDLLQGRKFDGKQAVARYFRPADLRALKEADDPAAAAAEAAARAAAEAAVAAALGKPLSAAAAPDAAPPAPDTTPDAAAAAAAAPAAEEYNVTPCPTPRRPRRLRRPRRAARAARRAQAGADGARRGSSGSQRRMSRGSQTQIEENGSKGCGRASRASVVKPLGRGGRAGCARAGAGARAGRHTRPLRVRTCVECASKRASCVEKSFVQISPAAAGARRQARADRHRHQPNCRACASKM